MKIVDVSIIIPTFNRLESLNRLLVSIEQQTVRATEILIIDSSPTPLKYSDLNTDLPIEIIYSTPSVCIQRNLGIQKAKGEYILLCDDDLELPENYIKTLLDYLKSNSNEGVVTGFWKQKENDGKWHQTYDIQSFMNLIFHYIFGLSLWGRIDQFRVSRLVYPIYLMIKYDYYRKGNSISKAGWPINTNFNGDVVSVQVTSLGSALIKKAWLHEKSFELVLDPSGIGDNYGVCNNLPNGKEIKIIKSLTVTHHKSTQNRLENLEAFYRRTLALHYFLNTLKQFKIINRICFKWSIVGLYIEAILRKDNKKRKTCWQLLGLGLWSTNPYITGKKSGLKTITPQLPYSQ